MKCMSPSKRAARSLWLASNSRIDSMKSCEVAVYRCRAPSLQSTQVTLVDEMDAEDYRRNGAWGNGADDETTRRFTESDGATFKQTVAALPGIGVSLLPKLMCPACWPAYAGLVSALGLSVLISAKYLLPLTVGFLAITALALGYHASRRHGYGPLWLGLVAVVRFADCIVWGGIGVTLRFRLLPHRLQSFAWLQVFSGVIEPFKDLPRRRIPTIDSLRLSLASVISSGCPQGR